MKRTSLLVTLLVSCIASAFGQTTAETGEPRWETDFEAALVAARDHDRVVVVNFTGSDWCVWCHRLRDEVFKTPAFADYAANDAILVEIDFPRNKSLPRALREQNAKLAERYGVNGYPTVLILDASGKKLGSVGYMRGGPKTFIRELRRIAKSAGPSS